MISDESKRKNNKTSWKFIKEVTQLQSMDSMIIENQFEKFKMMISELKRFEKLNEIRRGSKKFQVSKKISKEWFNPHAILLNAKKLEPWSIIVNI